MIKKIEIKKLFGRFDYNLEFKDENIMIITGPNGYGKSTILKIIYSIFCDRVEYINTFNFKSIVIYLNKSKIKIVKTEKGIEINDKLYTFPSVNDINEEYNHQLYIYSDDKNTDKDQEQQLITSILRRRNTNIKEQMLISDESFLPIFCYYWRLENRGKKMKKEIVSLIDLKSIIDKCKIEIGNISYIKEQRLLSTRKKYKYGQIETLYYNTILLNSEKLKEEFEKLIIKHSKLSNELDRTFLERLFKSNKKSNKKQLEDELNEVTNNQKALKKYGLLKENSSLRNLSQENYNKYQAELSIYISDMKKKYEVFDSFIKQIELYEEIVNNKLQFKKIELSIEKGIQVKTDDDKELELENLSSGEQNILVLYYSLIFESAANLIFIDEPEISLHIAWQDQFIGDLKKIINSINNKLQVIIATHSIELALNNTDIQIDLGGVYNEKFYKR